jgi:hypothetical protein
MLAFQAPQYGVTKPVTGYGKIPSRMSLRQRSYPAMRTTSVASLRSLGIAIAPAITIEADDRKERSRWNGGSYLYKRLCPASQLRVEPMATPGSALAVRMKHWCSPILTKLQSGELLKC